MLNWEVEKRYLRARVEARLSEILYASLLPIYCAFALT